MLETISAGSYLKLQVAEIAPASIGISTQKKIRELVEGVDSLMESAVMSRGTRSHRQFIETDAWAVSRDGKRETFS